MALAKVGWKVVGVLSGLVAARTSKKVLDATWAKTKGGEPPRNPAAPGTSWTEALTWAAASGVAVGVARLLAARGSAQAWKKTTGSLPPGLEEVGA
ncbi:MAG: hypothetical protein QOE99_2422 [Actinomycetota bacterium]|jgi:hypothetical protein|nr:hypothetical protein [Actinomycetota bacterium]